MIIITPLVCLSVPSQSSGGKRSGPQRIDEIIGIAQELGHHYRSDREDGQFQLRLLISESPLSWERANSLVVGRNESSDWIGTVAVLRPFPLDPHDLPMWGKFHLYGDPALIKKLTAQANSR
jgi:hypothetical protein